MRAKLIEKFGKEIENLEGFVDCLCRESFKSVTFTSGHTSEVIYAIVCGTIGLFIAEESRWESRGGLGKKTVVGVYRNKKTSKQKFQFIDQLDARRDNYKLQFEKLDVDSVYYDQVFVKVYAKNGSSSVLEFEIAGNENEKNEKEKEFDVILEKCKGELAEKYAKSFPEFQIKMKKKDYSKFEAVCLVILDPKNPNRLEDPLNPGFLTEFTIKGNE